MFNKDAAQTKPPGNWTLAFFVVVLAAGSVLVRLAKPPTLLNMHLMDFPQYILMFIAGIVAARGQWVTRISYASGIRWLAAALTAGLAIWFGIIEGGCAYCPGIRVTSPFWRMAFNTWEAFTCVAISFGLLCLFREHFSSQGRLAKYLSDNAFAVYVFHPPIVILGARLLHEVSWHPFLKFGLLTIFGVVISYALSGAVFRRIPLLREIL